MIIKVFIKKYLVNQLKKNLGKTGNTSENVLNEIRKIFIVYIAEKKLLKSIQQYNEFTKVMKQNRHYSYEF